MSNKLGASQWKGIYKDEYIGFHMNDPEYKDAVLSKRVSFTSGNIITCVLDIHRELNEVGEVKVKKYSVRTVLEKIEKGVFTETSGGKKYRRERKIQDSQGNLFS